jgi:GH24 family phage-related lysozyme (muramidase)
MDAIKARIKLKEGLRLEVYADTRGFLTVGYGHKITPDDNLKLGDKITQSQADNYFEHDFFWVLSGVKQIIKGFESKPIQVQTAILDMAYNNGIGGFKKFKKFIAAVEINDFFEAANQIVDSANYRSKDLHGRYVELEQMVRGAK